MPSEKDELLELARLARQSGDSALELKALEKIDAIPERGFLTEVGEGLTRFGEGLGQLGAKALGAVGIQSPIPFHQDPEQVTTQAIQSRRSEVPEAEGLVGHAGRWIGEAAPGFAFPVAKGVGLAGRLAGNAAVGAGLGAAQFTPEGESKLAQTLTGAALGGLAPEAIGVAGAGVRKALGASPEASARFRAFGQAGARPTVGQVTGSKPVQGLETALAKAPGSRGRMTKHIEQAQQALDDSVEGISKRLSGNVEEVSPFVAGGEIKQGIADFSKKFREESSRRYAELDELIPADEMVPVVNTLQKTRELLGKSPIQQGQVPEQVKRHMSTLLDSVKSGEISFADMQSLRTQLGENINTSELVTNVPKSVFKQVYGALSQDMRRAASARGADKMFDDINSFYKTNSELINKTLRNINNKAEPEDVFKAALQGTREGARKLRSVKKTLSQDQWNIVAATQLKKMGTFVRDGEEVFSSGTFLGNWGRMDKEAKNLLFSDKAYTSGLDDLVKAMGSISEQSRQLSNPSGTAGNLINQVFSPGGFSIAAAFDPSFAGMMVGGMLASNVAGRLLTNQRLVRWLAQGTKVKTPSAMRQWVARGSALGIPALVNQQSENF